MMMMMMIIIIITTATIIIIIITLQLNVDISGSVVPFSRTVNEY
jgi:hypothetical protein